MSFMECLTVILCFFSLLPIFPPPPPLPHTHTHTHTHHHTHTHPSNLSLSLHKVSAVCAALVDRNVLVQRGALDVVSILFPFHQSFLLLPDLTSVLSAALRTLLKRDVSLSRRLYVWLLGSQVHKGSLVNHVRLHSNGSGDSATAGEIENGHSALDADNMLYFEKYSKVYLILAMEDIMVHAKEASRLSLSKMECVLPYRLLRALLDRPEIGLVVTESIMPGLVLCLKEQIEGLGGVHPSHAHSSREGSSINRHRGPLLGNGNSKKTGKKGSLRADIVQSANLLFTTLSQDFVWSWVAAMLEKCSADDVTGVEANVDKLAGNSDPPPDEEAGHFTPVSEFLESTSNRRELSHVRASGTAAVEQRHSESDKPLSLNTLLAMLMFLMKVIPQVKVNAGTSQCRQKLHAT